MLNRRCLPAIAMLGITVCFVVARAEPPQPSFPDVDALPEHPEMPDPLTMNDGQKVTTPDQWLQRREEIKRVIVHYFLGNSPPPPGNVKGTELAARDLAGGKVKFRLVHLSFGPEEKLGMDVAVFTPAQGGPFPTIVHPSFSPTPGAPVPAAATRPTSTRPVTNPVNEQRRVENIQRQADPENAAQRYAPILDRGYALLTYWYQEAGLDQRDCRGSGFFPAYPDYDWGEFAAWAWGMSRCVDWLQTQPFADKTKLIAVGHSRLGKTTLIAGAMDDRFALVAPAGSGCAGTAAFRFSGRGRGGQREDLEEYLCKFPQHVSPRLAQFAGHVEKLPWDQHWLIALVAPRPLIAADGLSDSVSSVTSLKASYMGAKPVYDLLGVPDNLGVHYRPGGHMLAPEDWQAILDFADARLRNKPTTQRFDEFPTTAPARGDVR